MLHRRYTGWYAQYFAYWFESTFMKSIWYARLYLRVSASESRYILDTFISTFLSTNLGKFYCYPHVAGRLTSQQRILYRILLFDAYSVVNMLKVRGRTIRDNASKGL